MAVNAVLYVPIHVNTLASGARNGLQSISYVFQFLSAESFPRRKGKGTYFASVMQDASLPRVLQPTFIFGQSIILEPFFALKNSFLSNRSPDFVFYVVGCVFLDRAGLAF